MLFKDFTGRDPYIEPLLVRRGLVATPAADDAQPAAKAGKADKGSKGSKK